MSDVFSNTSHTLEEYLDNLDRSNEYEFHYSKVSGAEVTTRFGQVENIQYHDDNSLTITCIFDKKKGIASTNNLNESSIKSTINKSKTIASFLEEDIYQGLPRENLIKKTDIDCGINFPKEYTTQEMIDITTECEKSALDYDKRISNSEGSQFLFSRSKHLILNSNGARGSYSSTSYTLSCVVLAEDKGLKERDYAYSTKRNYQRIDNPSEIGRLSAEKAVGRLGAKSISSKICPIILSPELSVGLIASFLSAIDGNNIYKKNSFLLDKLGKNIFSDHITIKENPNLIEGLGNKPFDNEGVITSEKKIIDSGMLETFLLDTYSARQLKSVSTGNCGYTNILIESSIDQPDDIISNVDDGVLVTEMMGSGANILTGDYSRGAFGYLIKNGKISHPVTNFTVASNMLDMFKNISAIGNDTYNNSKIKCGSLLIDKMTIGGN